MSDNALRRRITSITYRALYWARYHVAPGVRSLLGLLLMVGGVFGFLPVLGFWMFPLGVAFVAMDLPLSQHRIERWMQRLALEAELASAVRPTVSVPPPGNPGGQRAEDPPTSSQ